VALEFEEVLECLARCAVDRFRGIAHMGTVSKLRAMTSNVLGEASLTELLSAATHVSAPRFASPLSLRPLSLLDGAEREWLGTWQGVRLGSLHGFPLWEGGVHDVLHATRVPLCAIFRAYAAASSSGASAETMDTDELRDLAVDVGIATARDELAAVCACAAESGALVSGALDLSGFLSALVHISVLLSPVDDDHRSAAVTPAATPAEATTESGAVRALPSCLTKLLHECVLPRARRDTDAARFAAEVLPLPTVQRALALAEPQLHRWYTSIAAGQPFLDLEQWLDALDDQLLLSTLTIDGHEVRLTRPQAAATFHAACDRPSFGMVPDELPAAVARLGCAFKYCRVAPMDAGAKVRRRAARSPCVRCRHAYDSCTRVISYDS
jgi:hypothetical protein